MSRANQVCGVVLRVLGAVLLVAAGLKGHQLLTEPLAENSIWSSRPLLILQVELELVLGVWLLSGLFARAAWLVSLACFGFFSLVTLYKGLTGAASCGCFGAVSVNPWVTLLAIDLPAVIALAVVRPNGAFAVLWTFLRRRESAHRLILEFLTPSPSPAHFGITACLAAGVLLISAPLLVLNKPAPVTATYEVLEPQTWLGRQLPILEHIDIAERLQRGTWLLLFYHYDCPDCRQAIPQYEQMARDLAGNEDFLRIALIAVPPFGPAPPGPASPCTLGRLADVKEWFITTPAVALLTDARVRAAWEQTAPDLETIILHLTAPADNSARDPDLHATNEARHSHTGAQVAPLGL